MKILITLITVSILLSGCDHSEIKEIEVKFTSNKEKTVSSQTVNSIDQHKASIQKIVKETSQTVFSGKDLKVNITDHVKHKLSEYFSDIRLKIADSKINFDVDCRDPIYHITFEVINGKVEGIKVSLTPVCYEQQE